MNENHDEKGRFSAGGAGWTGKGSGPAPKGTYNKHGRKMLDNDSTPSDLRSYAREMISAARGKAGADRQHFADTALAARSYANLEAKALKITGR